MVKENSEKRSLNERSAELMISLFCIALEALACFLIGYEFDINKKGKTAKEIICGTISSFIGGELLSCFPFLFGSAVSKFEGRLLSITYAFFALALIYVFVRWIIHPKIKNMSHVLLVLIAQIIAILGILKYFDQDFHSLLKCYMEFDESLFRTVLLPSAFVVIYCAVQIVRLRPKFTWLVLTLNLVSLSLLFVILFLAGDFGDWFERVIYLHMPLYPRGYLFERTIFLVSGTYIAPVCLCSLNLIPYLFATASSLLILHPWRDKPNATAFCCLYCLFGGLIYIFAISVALESTLLAGPFIAFTFLLSLPIFYVLDRKGFFREETSSDQTLITMKSEPSSNIFLDKL